MKKILTRKQESFRIFLYILPCLIFIFAFSYLPLRGWIYAFTDYKPGYKLSDLTFVGTKYFTLLFGNEIMRRQIAQVMLNTIGMGLLGILFSPLPVIFAIFLNEMSSTGFRKIVQSLTTLPNFVSWVVMYSVVFSVLSNSGLVNNLLLDLGLISTPINFMATDKHVWLTMQMYGLWKGLGWSSVVYLASIAGIDQEQYEAATIDGAGRFAKMWYITVPGLTSTYFVLLVMGLGNFLNTGMEQYYIFQNAVNKEYIQVLDLYVYNLGIGSGNIPLATAVGIMKSGVSLILLTVANLLSKRSVVSVFFKRLM